MNRREELIIGDYISSINKRKKNIKKYHEMYLNNGTLLQSDYLGLADHIKDNPEIIRPITANDIVVGSLYVLVVKASDYHISMNIGQSDKYFVGTIDEVLYPDDQYKAFCSDDGCRYGLNSCYVIKEEYR